MSTHIKIKERPQGYRLRFSVDCDRFMEISFSPKLAMQVVDSIDALSEQDDVTSIIFRNGSGTIYVSLDKGLANTIRDDMEASALRGVVLPPQLQIAESSGKRKLIKWWAMMRIFFVGETI